MPAPIALSHSLHIRSSGSGMITGLGEERRPLLLLVDPYVNHLEPEIGKATILVLKRLGYDPELCFMDCSLRLLVSEGFLDEAKNGLKRLRDDLISRQTMPIVGLEPAELLLLRDEAAVLLGDAWPKN